MKKGENRGRVRNILFVCRYNRFRSRIAAAYFRKMTDGKFKVKSAGIVRGDPINKMAKKVAQEFGLDISGKPRGLSSKLLLWSDKIFVVADDVPIGVFGDNKGSLGKTTILKIKDAKGEDYKNIKEVAKNVIKEVKKLAKVLEK